MDYKLYQEKIQQLYTDFPLCFPAPPYCGFSIGEGWFENVKELCAKLEAFLSKLTKEEQKAFQIAQCKEKFGGLRFYVDYPPGNESLYNQINELIKEAEEKCSKTCEACGAPGTLKTDRWWRTLCEDCENKRIRQRALDQRTSFILTHARNTSGMDWREWLNLDEEVKKTLIKEAEIQLLNEGKIKSVEETIGQM